MSHSVIIFGGCCMAVIYQGLKSNKTIKTHRMTLIQSFWFMKMLIFFYDNLHKYSMHSRMGVRNL